MKSFGMMAQFTKICKEEFGLLEFKFFSKNKLNKPRKPEYRVAKSSAGSKFPIKYE